ncbi:MAG: hypothetical protein ACTSU5_04740 [Promethearchaeota archaeon]
MSFCDQCGNLMLPRKKNGKKYLYCKTCEVEIPADRNQTEYRLESSNLNGKISSTSKIVEGEIHHRITEDDRETFEEFFAAGSD